MSRITVKAVRQRAAPAESPARTIFDGEMGLCGASGGGSIRYRSGHCQSNINLSYLIPTCC
jgi:hypothetical protein